VDAGHNARIPVTVCGEMAGEPLYITILLGFELDSLSMNPQAIPRVKNLIRRSTLRKCRTFLQKILEMGTAREISDLLQELVLREFPEEFRYFDPSALRVSGAYGNTREDVKT
jgi:phosphotransferase system enzyme I (PtsI)